MGLAFSRRSVLLWPFEGLALWNRQQEVGERGFLQFLDSLQARELGGRRITAACRAL
jgi:hypothetical protein